MELFLIKALAVLRPMLFIRTDVEISGLNLFEMAAVIFTMFLMAAFAMRGATHKQLQFSIIDALILGYVVWCVAIYVIYLDKAQASVLAKFVIPLLTYIVAKNVIPDNKEYAKTLWLLVLGFCIPLCGSALLIISGGGQEYVNYWTGVPRYRGAYAGPHEMSHNAAFLLMAVWLYVLLLKQEYVSLGGLTAAKKMVLGILILAALFCLYQSHVRTTILGLIVFGSVLVATYYKRPLLLVIGAAVLASSFLVSENVRDRFFPEGEQAEKSRQFDVGHYASSRPEIWSNQIRVFASLPFDRQLAGIGIGNSLAKEGKGDFLWLDAHNDFLRVMIHTGIVGLVLFVALQLAILNRILRLDASVRYPFLALFAAVTVMNLVSNSYVNRFGLAQMFYLVMAYVDLPKTQPKPVPAPDLSEQRQRYVEGRFRRGAMLGDAWRR